jgi:hypothetical protein
MRHWRVRPTPACAALVLLTAAAGLAESHIKVLKLAVTNPGGEARQAQNVVVAVSALKAIAKDFTAGTRL